MIRKAALLPMIAAAFALGACETSPTGSATNARLTVQLTDAPSSYLESAVVEISRVEILSASGPPRVVVEDAGTFDLLTLQNGVTAQLGTIDIEPGTYTQLRMIVESAVLTLKDGYTFTDGSRTTSVKVPSGAQTGIKINLFDSDDQSGVMITPGATVLVVDFDVSSNFVMQGNADTAEGIKGFLFTPSLRAVVRDVAGSISGTVTAPGGVTVKDLTVTATRDGAPDGEAPAATLVKDGGTYTVHFLAPGKYFVTVSDAPENHSSSTVEVTVGESQHVQGVNLAITAD